MREYRIINKDGLELEVNENELYKIAEHWVDDWNQIEHSYAESNGENLEERLWEYPNDLGQVEEILGEYMNCEIIELDNDEIHKDTAEMYRSLLG